MNWREHTEDGVGAGQPMETSWGCVVCEQDKIDHVRGDHCRPKPACNACDRKSAYGEIESSWAY